MRLIDGDALKEEVKTIFCPDGYKIMMLERINNAPELGYEDGVLSVENATRRAIELEEAYNNGWSDGFNEGESERPKGEWIKDGVGNITCSNCGFSLGSKVVKLLYPFDFPYCFECGTKMKGD